MRKLRKGEGKRKRNMYRNIGEIFILFYQLYVKKKPDLRYPALRKAGYPAKSVSGASLMKGKK